MITVNFTVDTGETTYLYSFTQCVGDKNVTFKLQDSYNTWCHITPGTNSIKISVDAVPLTQEAPRSARVNIYLNDPSQTTPCSEYFQITQPGRVQCNCTTFAPILIGATFAPSGASVDTVIGTYTNGSCPVGTISIVGTNGLKAEATNGQIKLTRAISAYEDGRDFEVSFKFTDALGTTIECATGTCSQTKVTCDCKHVGQIITMSDKLLPFDEQDMVLIATADKSCGVFSAVCESDMLDTVIGDETYPGKVRVDDDGTTIRAYVHVKQTSAYRSCSVTPLLKFKGQTDYIPCDNGAITLTQSSDYIKCSSLGNVRPQVVSQYLFCGSSYAVDQYTYYQCNYTSVMDLAYSVRVLNYDINDVAAIPRIDYLGELAESDYNLRSNSNSQHCWTEYGQGTQYTGDKSDWVTEDPTALVVQGQQVYRYIAKENNSNVARYIRIAYDLYVYGEFCKTLDCTTNLLILPCICDSCVSDITRESWDSNLKDDYEQYDEDFNYIESMIKSFACNEGARLSGVYVGTDKPSFSDYVHITDLRGDSEQGYTFFHFTVDENDTDEDFRYYLSLTFTLGNGKECNVVVRARTKLHNICGNVCEVLDNYANITKNYNIGNWQTESSNCHNPFWRNNDKYLSFGFKNDTPCDDNFRLYFVVIDGDGNEVGPGEFTNQNGNRMSATTHHNYTYVPNLGWTTEQGVSSSNFRINVYGYYNGEPGTTVDLSFKYRYRLRNEDTGETCDTPIYDASGSIKILCEVDECVSPTCTSNFVYPTISLISGVPTIIRPGDKTKVLFPATGATYTAYTFSYNDGYSRYDWCEGYSLKYTTDSTYSYIHPSIVTENNESKLVIQLDSTTNEEGQDCTADIHVFIDFDGILTECSGSNMTVELYQQGTKEN